MDFLVAARGRSPRPRRGFGVFRGLSKTNRRQSRCYLCASYSSAAKTPQFEQGLNLFLFFPRFRENQSPDEQFNPKD